MAIYVIRYVAPMRTDDGEFNCVKIGYSENPRRRVNAIRSSGPELIEFVGYMPGDREVEKHLHSIFAENRVNGEWFIETDDMRHIFSLLLIKELDEAPDRRRKIRKRDNSVTVRVSKDVRAAALSLWPEKKVSERILMLASEVGWPVSRMKDAYYADRRVSLRTHEVEAVDRWLSKRLAFFIAPEIRGEG